jgi:hypothetical protein
VSSTTSSFNPQPRKRVSLQETGSPSRIYFCSLVVVPSTQNKTELYAQLAAATQTPVLLYDAITPAEARKALAILPKLDQLWNAPQQQDVTLTSDQAKTTTVIKTVLPEQETKRQSNPTHRYRTRASSSKSSADPTRHASAPRPSRQGLRRVNKAPQTDTLMVNFGGVESYHSKRMYSKLSEARLRHHHYYQAQR